MDYSIINPNQIRHFGIPDSDDLYNLARDFGINHNKLFISFETKGCVIYFDICVPTDGDLETLTHIALTDDKNGVSAQLKCQAINPMEKYNNYRVHNESRELYMHLSTTNRAR